MATAQLRLEVEIAVEELVTQAIIAAALVSSFSNAEQTYW
jgi:hypothetical protein